MKFLCVPCDEPMKLDHTEGPDQGSLTAIFICPQCGRETAMLTNPWETQMVRSLDVELGGRKGKPEPMAMLRSALAQKRPGVFLEGQTETVDHPADYREESPKQAGSKCPFTGIAEEAFTEAKNQARWTQEAEARLGRIPEAVQPMVKKGIEYFAQQEGITEITEAVVEQAKNRFGM